MTRTVALALCLVGGLAVNASAATLYSESSQVTWALLPRSPC